MNPDRMEACLEVARRHGIEINTADQARDVITAVKYCDVKFAHPNWVEDDICREIGVSVVKLSNLKKRGIVSIASKIVLAEFMTSEARNDIRNRLFAIYQEGMPKALENIARMAAGLPVNHPNGKVAPAPPRDQVAAFREMASNPMATAWFANTFFGEISSPEEEEFLRLREKLLEGGEVLLLDSGGEVFDGETVPASDASEAVAAS